MTYNPRDDFNKSVNECYRAIKERVANGGPGWSQNNVPANLPNQAKLTALNRLDSGEFQLTFDLFSGQRHSLLVTEDQLELLEQQRRKQCGQPVKGAA